MRAFAALYQRLDRSTSSLQKRAALVAYFRVAPAEDAAWALWLLTGGKVGGAKARIASSSELRQWIGEESGLPGWLVDASYDQVGDLAETLALLLDETTDPAPDIGLAEWIREHLLPVANAAPELRRAVVTRGWRQLPMRERFVFNKLLTGALRVGVSQGLVQQALAELSGLDVPLLAQRLLGFSAPSAAALQAVLAEAGQAGDTRLPYPFFLASALEVEPGALGAIDDWLLEWKWDGIRVQLIRRGNDIVLWSRGEERMDGRFPEIEAELARLAHDAVIDGELLAWQQDAPQPLPFTALQTRIQRRKPGPKVMMQVPARVMAYDLLELDGQDLREQPLQQRRASLAALLAAHDSPVLQLSPALALPDWDTAAGLRNEARQRGVEGFMLKRRQSPYRHGRKRGDWWKWKVDPLTVDAVLLYAQSGHGRRSTLYTDYTFGVWDGDTLVPIAKAYSGLDDKEIVELDRWIRAHTTERYGPVRAVQPLQVFELGFEAVNLSKRHKSGVALRFPRIVRWRHDKPAGDADRLESLRKVAQ